MHNISLRCISCEKENAYITPTGKMQGTELVQATAGRESRGMPGPLRSAQTQTKL